MREYTFQLTFAGFSDSTIEQVKVSGVESLVEAFQKAASLAGERALRKITLVDIYPA